MFNSSLLFGADKLGQFRRSQLAASFVQQNNEIIFCDGIQQLRAFRCDDALFVTAALLFQFAHFATSKSLNAVQILSSQRGAMLVFGFADPDETQLQTSTRSASRQSRS